MISTCNLTWRLGSFEINSTYTIGTPFETLEFTGLDLTNCPFDISVYDMTDTASPVALDPAIFLITQPTLVQSDPDNNNDYTVTEYGSITIQTDDNASRGVHPMRVIVNPRRYTNETVVVDESMYVDFKVTILACESVPENS